MSNDVLIELSGAGVSFRSETRRRGLFLQREPFWGLRGIDLALSDGDRLGVIGRNGAGKSTLMRLLAGVFEPDEGSVVRRVKPVLLSIGAGFIQQLSGRQNIYLNGALLGLRRRDIQQLEPDIIAFSELGEFIDAPVRTYSTGMRTRLGFSISSFLRPDVLLLDETLSAGDRFFRKKAKARMREMAGECRAIVLAAHQERVIKDMCNRAIWVDAGRILAQGEVDEILEAYNAQGEGKA